MSTAQIAARNLTEGVRFIPAGRVRPVEVLAVWQGRHGIEVAAASAQGCSAHVLNPDSLVTVLA